MKARSRLLTNETQRSPLVGRALAGLALMVTVLTLSGWFSHSNFSRGEYKTDRTIELPDFWKHWDEFDAGWYELIAKRGYIHYPNSQSTVAFFPGYPLAMRAAAPLFGGNVSVAGVVLTLLSGVIAVGLFANWCRDRLDHRAAVLAVALILVYPYSFYLAGPIYADAFFLAASLGAFHFVERDRTVLAGLCGALATATRPVAPAIVLALVLRVAERRGALRSYSLVSVGASESGRAGAAVRLRRWAEHNKVPVGLEIGRAHV